MLNYKVICILKGDRHIHFTGPMHPNFPIAYQKMGYCAHLGDCFHGDIELTVEVRSDEN